MKTCEPHSFNPPSKCPNCRRAKARLRREASRKGWETRRLNDGVEAENLHIEKEEIPEALAAHGWLS